MGQTVQRRAEERTDVFELAQLRVGRESLSRPVKVRNLSSQGMMGEGPFSVSSGTRLTIDLPDRGSVAGTVVWVQQSRFGVAFDRDIDPKFA